MASSAPDFPNSPDSPDSPDDGYLLDNARQEAGTRFGALGELFDASTFRAASAPR